MVGKARIDLAEPRQIASEQPVNEMYALPDVERFIDGEAGAIKDRRMVAGRVERDDDGAARAEGDDDRPEPERKTTNNEIPGYGSGSR